MATKKELPAWALEAATTEDRERTDQARSQGTMQITWPDKEALRGWTGTQLANALVRLRRQVPRYDARQR